MACTKVISSVTAALTSIIFPILGKIICNEEINDFFQSNIMRVENPNASVLASVVLRENGSFSTVDPPYLKTKNLKQYKENKD